MKRLLTFLFFSIFFISVLTAQNCDSVRVWVVADFLRTQQNSVSIVGTPTILSSPYGEAVYFNGLTDGIFLPSNLLVGLSRYTIEVLFCPDSNGAREQRFLHFGELRGDRTLLEIRLANHSWALDAYVKSGDSARTLFDSAKTHPVQKWYHIALVVDGSSVVAYVDGEKELESLLVTLPQRTGKTSLGVRLNKQYWFKGSIAMLAISSSALTPSQFKLPLQLQKEQSGEE